MINCIACLNDGLFHKSFRLLIKNFVLINFLIVFNVINVSSANANNTTTTTNPSTNLFYSAINNQDYSIDWNYSLINFNRKTYFFKLNTVSPLTKNKTIFNEFDFNLTSNFFSAFNNTNDVLLKIAQIQWKHPLFGILLISITLITIFGNCLVIYAIIRERHLKSATNYYIASLALADLIVGLVVMPFNSINEMTNNFWFFGDLWCDMWHSFDVFASTASILSLLIIALDRHSAISDPISYHNRLLTRHWILFVLGIWICSACISFPAIGYWRWIRKPDSYVLNECLFTDDIYYLVFSSSVSFYIPLTVMVVVYIRIYRAATRQMNALKSGQKVNVKSADGTPMTLRIHRGGYHRIDTNELNNQNKNINNPNNTTSNDSSSSSHPINTESINKNKILKTLKSKPQTNLNPSNKLNLQLVPKSKSEQSIKYLNEQDRKMFQLINNRIGLLSSLSLSLSNLQLTHLADNLSSINRPINKENGFLNKLKNQRRNSCFPAINTDLCKLNKEFFENLKNSINQKSPTIFNTNNNISLSSFIFSSNINNNRVRNLNLMNYLYLSGANFDTKFQKTNDDLKIIVTNEDNELNENKHGNSQSNQSRMSSDYDKLAVPNSSSLINSESTDNILFHENLLYLNMNKSNSGDENFLRNNIKPSLLKRKLSSLKLAKTSSSQLTCNNLNFINKNDDLIGSKLTKSNSVKSTTNQNSPVDEESLLVVRKIFKFYSQHYTEHYLMSNNDQLSRQKINLSHGKSRLRNFFHRNFFGGKKNPPSFGRRRRKKLNYLKQDSTSSNVSQKIPENNNNNIHYLNNLPDLINLEDFTDNNKNLNKKLKNENRLKTLIRSKVKSLSLTKKLCKFSREQKAAKTLGIVMGVFIICWLPFFIYNVATGIFKAKLPESHESIYSIFTWFGFINSGCNPIIYAFSSRDFRRAFYKILLPQRFLKNSKRNAKREYYSSFFSNGANNPNNNNNSSSLNTNTNNLIVSDLKKNNKVTNCALCKIYENYLLNKGLNGLQNLTPDTVQFLKNQAGLYDNNNNNNRNDFKKVSSHQLINKDQNGSKSKSSLALTKSETSDFMINNNNCNVINSEVNNENNVRLLKSTDLNKIVASKSFGAGSSNCSDSFDNCKTSLCKCQSSPLFDKKNVKSNINYNNQNMRFKNENLKKSSIENDLFIARNKYEQPSKQQEAPPNSASFTSSLLVISKRQSITSISNMARNLRRRVQSIFLTRNLNNNNNNNNVNNNCANSSLNRRIQMRSFNDGSAESVTSSLSLNAMKRAGSANLTNSVRKFDHFKLNSLKSDFKINEISSLSAKSLAANQTTTPTFHYTLRHNRNIPITVGTTYRFTKNGTATPQLITQPRHFLNDESILVRSTTKSDEDNSIANVIIMRPSLGLTSNHQNSTLFNHHHQNYHHCHNHSNNNEIWSSTAGKNNKLNKNKKPVKQIYSFRNQTNFNLNSPFGAYSSTETYNEDVYLSCVNNKNSGCSSDDNSPILKLTELNEFKKINQFRKENKNVSLDNNHEFHLNRSSSSNINYKADNNNNSLSNINEYRF